MMRRSGRVRKATTIFEPAEENLKKRKRLRIEDNFCCPLCHATRWCRTGRLQPTSGAHTSIHEGGGGNDILCRSCTIKVKKKRRTEAAREEKARNDSSREEQQRNASSVARRLLERIGCNDESLSELLYCTYYKKKPCRCVDRYIDDDVGRVVDIVRLHGQATLNSKLKYEKIDPNRKKNRPGYGNGQKKSARFTDFVIAWRTTLKVEWKLCERAVQRILRYSNNFLHKRLKTESNSRRLQRTKGQAALGLLRPLREIWALKCCPDRCSRMARTHENLVARWRHDSGQGQACNRRVLLEMLTPSGGRANCHQFIAMITGCAVATIERVRASLVGLYGTNRFGSMQNDQSDDDDSVRHQTTAHGTTSEPMSDSEPESMIEDNQRKSEQVPLPNRKLTENRSSTSTEAGYSSNHVEASYESEDFRRSGGNVITQAGVSSNIVRWDEEGSAFRAIIRPGHSRHWEFPSIGGFSTVSGYSRAIDHGDQSTSIVRQQSARNLSDSYDLSCRMDSAEKSDSGHLTSNLTGTENAERTICEESPTYSTCSSDAYGTLTSGFCVSRERPRSQPKLSAARRCCNRGATDEEFDFSQPSRPKSRTRHVSLPSKRHFHSGLPDVRSAIRTYRLPPKISRPIIVNEPLRRSPRSSTNPRLIFAPELSTFIPLDAVTDYVVSPDLEFGGESRPPLRPGSTLDKEGVVISGRESDWSRFLDVSQ